MKHIIFGDNKRKGKNNRFQTYSILRDQEVFFIFQSKVGTNTIIVDTVKLIIKSQTSPGILTDKPDNARGQTSILKA